MNKTTALKWQNQAIQDAILKSNWLDYSQYSYVEFLCQPTFANDFLLQLVWQPQKILWYRSTWVAEQDQEMLDTWLSYLQEDEEVLPLDLTFLHEKGEVNSLIIKDLVKEINNLSIKPVLFDDERWGRDGEEITLKIGSGKSLAVFHWYTCATPAQWAELDKLAKTLLQLNKELK
jgi:hypothetical protein